MNPRRTAAMNAALDYVAEGVSVADAANTAGVTVQALYRAMRRDGISGPRERCGECGRLLPHPAG